ncbi:MAG: CalY family protein [Oscillospiraceae bacterium]|nr:CalY family protein [Oscillospiraceae bacterium]
MKKKMILGIIAAVLVLGLVIGGTLMLLTTVTPTATNAVTIGAAEIILRERGGYILRDGERIPIDSVDEPTVVSGIEFGIVVPGDILEKEPSVENIGSVDVFIAVKGSLTVSKDGEAVTGEQLAAFFAANESAIRDFFNSIEGTDDAWWGESAQYIDGDALVGSWYLINPDTKALEALAAGEVTPDVFGLIKVPEYLDNSWSGVTLTLALTAYGVQSDNSGYDPADTGEADYYNFFQTIFSTAFDYK